MATIEAMAAAVELGTVGRGAIAKARRWLNVEPELFSSGGIGLTATQVAEIRSFLASPNVRLVVAALGVCYMTERNASLSGDFVAVFQSAFEAQVEDHALANRLTWGHHKTAIWHEVTAQLLSQLPRLEVLVEDDDERSSYLAFVQTPLYTAPGLAAKNTFQKRVCDAVGSLESLAAAEGLTRQIAEFSRAASMPLFSHLPIDVAIDRAALYIDRDIAIEGATVPVPSDQLFGLASYRVVLLGNPGAGKTTLVEHLRRIDDPTSVAPHCTVVLKCREYASDMASSSLTSALFLAANRDLGLQGLSESELDLALTLGQVAVVFDGLDEILNAQSRMDFVQQVERFTRQYPLASVLVTSRSRGYEQAPIDRRLFATIRLSEYSWDQVMEYARKWFGALGQPSLVEPFMREVSGTDDIAINPLLLSLLCSLYKVDGHIPSNRYEIYNRCADLLFWRWDQHRQIRHPEAVPNYGVPLMEFLGSTFFTHQAAQSGMDEKQLVRLLATYLRDTHGSVNPEARAQDFLDFCADRAWLLAVLSMNEKHGVRVFGFTHRTFYEYFSARSIARSENDPAVIAEYAVQQYKKDRGSFIPELLIQAADQARERNGARVFGAAMAKTVEPGLLLRLMNAPMRNDLRIYAFDKMAEVWSLKGADIADVQGIQSLNSDAKHQFLLQADGQWQVRGVVRLLDEWSRVGFRVHGETFNDKWSRECYIDLLARYSGALLADYRPPGGRIPHDTHRVRTAAFLLGMADGSIVDIQTLLGRPFEGSGLLPALLSTDGSWIVGQALGGVQAAIEVLENSVVTQYFAESSGVVIEDSLPVAMEVKRWTPAQVDLAVALRLVLRSCKSDCPRLDGALEEAGLLKESRDGRVSWKRELLPEWAGPWARGRRFVTVAMF